MITYLALLQFKHWYIDFVLQDEAMVAGKGIYGNLVGMWHSFQHGIGTFLISVLVVEWKVAACIAMFDFITHYHIDWVKMNLNSKMGWGPNTHEQFWWLLGLDQFLHAMTYVGLVALVTV
jgi:hypothetical protein